MLKVWALLVFVLAHHCSSVPLGDFYTFNQSTVDELLEIEPYTIEIFVATIGGLNCGNADRYNVSVGGITEFIPASPSTNPLMAFKLLTVSVSDIDRMEVYYRARTPVPDDFKTKLFGPFEEAFGRNHSMFGVTYFAVVTWIIELNYGSSTNNLVYVNKFQLFFATSSTMSLVVYLYADGQLQWANSTRNEYASMGIDACSSTWTHPNSSKPTIANDLVTGSNVRIPGMWMFLIRDSTVFPAVICRDGCSRVTGTCTVADTCDCVPGYEGVNCTTPSCPAGCDNGQCNAPFNCTCDDKWSGEACNVADCPSACVNGMCSVPDVCTCNAGWTGENCVVPICTTACMNGTCIGPDTCDCLSGYKGNICQLPICKGREDCMGTCKIPGECICDAGYTGELCDITSPLSSSPPLTSQVNVQHTSSPLESLAMSHDSVGSCTPIIIDEGLSGGIVGGLLVAVIIIMVVIGLIIFSIMFIVFRAKVNREVKNKVSNKNLDNLPNTKFEEGNEQSDDLNTIGVEQNIAYGEVEFPIYF